MDLARASQACMSHLQGLQGHNLRIKSHAIVLVCYTQDGQAVST